MIGFQSKKNDVLELHIEGESRV